MVATTLIGLTFLGPRYWLTDTDLPRPRQAVVLGTLTVVP